MMAGRRSNRTIFCLFLLHHIHNVTSQF
jgi:hypothetical protein